MTEHNETTVPRRKQTRRSISVSQEIYDRISRFAEDHDTSRSAVVEKSINTFFEAPR